MSYTDHNYLEAQSRPFIRSFEEASLRIKERRSKEQALLNSPDLKHQTQPEATLQSEQLTKRFDDQMVEVNALLASIPGSKPITKAVKATASVEVANATHNTIIELADENYRTTLIANMIQLIHSKRKMK